jgi:Eukaryotic translation initiation factor 3 subunit 8 N-terminus
MVASMTTHPSRDCTLGSFIGRYTPCEIRVGPSGPRGSTGVHGSGPSYLGGSGQIREDTAICHPGAISGKPTLDDSTCVAKKTSYGELMNAECTYVYKYGTEHAKKRATVCHVYDHAVHNRYLEARDLLLMSHVNSSRLDGRENKQW